MYIDNSIFRDAINVNDKLQKIKGFGNEDNANAIINAEDKYHEIKLRIAEKDAGPEYLESKNYNEDVLMDNTWGDGELQLWFVPDNSMLAKGLHDYYNYIDTEYYGNYSNEVSRFAQDGIAVKANDKDNPLGEDGFYFANCSGCSFTDNLFVGVPVKHSHHAVSGVIDGSGSGVPAKRFLYFLNYKDNDNTKYRKLMQKNDYQAIK